MQNKWLEKHFRRNTGWTVEDNYMPIVLTSSEEIGFEMPILRANYLELQTVWNVYAAECQLNERKRSWENTFTNTSMIWE